MNDVKTPSDLSRRAANLWAFSLIGRGIVVAAHLDAPPVQLRVDYGVITMTPFTNTSRPVARFGPPILVSASDQYPTDFSRCFHVVPLERA